MRASGILGARRRAGAAAVRGRCARALERPEPPGHDPYQADAPTPVRLGCPRRCELAARARRAAWPERLPRSSRSPCARVAGRPHLRRRCSRSSASTLRWPLVTAECGGSVIVPVVDGLELADRRRARARAERGPAPGRGAGRRVGERERSTAFASSVGRRDRASLGARGRAPRARAPGRAVWRRLARARRDRVRRVDLADRRAGPVCGRAARRARALPRRAARAERAAPTRSARSGPRATGSTRHPTVSAREIVVLTDGDAPFSGRFLDCDGEGASSRTSGRDLRGAAQPHRAVRRATRFSRADGSSDMVQIASFGAGCTASSRVHSAPVRDRPHARALAAGRGRAPAGAGARARRRGDRAGAAGAGLEPHPRRGRAQPDHRRRARGSARRPTARSFAGALPLVPGANDDRARGRERSRHAPRCSASASTRRRAQLERCAGRAARAATSSSKRARRSSPTRRRRASRSSAPARASLDDRAPRRRAAASRGARRPEPARRYTRAHDAARLHRRTRGHDGPAHPRLARGPRATSSVVELPEALRKDPPRGATRSPRADLAVLCLPDDAAREAVALAQRAARRASSTRARRTASRRAGCSGCRSSQPEQRAAIAGARARLEPGLLGERDDPAAAAARRRGARCRATRAIALHGLSGYSGGGKELIARWEDPVGRPAHPRVRGALRARSRAQAHSRDDALVAGSRTSRCSCRRSGPFRCGMRRRDSAARAAARARRVGQDDLGSARRALPRRAVRARAADRRAARRGRALRSIRAPATTPTASSCACCRTRRATCC